MKRSQHILAVAGLALAVWAMAYGFYYAVWVEHQTLEHIGTSLAATFQHAATGDMALSRANLDEYARANYGYTREVDAHSHWIGLAMVLLALAALWDRLAFGERAGGWVAGALILGAYGFPLGVLLQNYLPAAVGQGIAVAATGLLVIAFGLVALGFARESIR
jgi:hypothetical protein